LARDEIETIHTKSLETLENTGVIVKNFEAIKMLNEAGCSIKDALVRIPSNLVEESIRKAPSSFQLYSREGDVKYTVGGDNIIFNPGSSAIYFIDRKTRVMRRAKAKDLKDLVRLTDALKHIYAQSTAMVPSDVPDIISDLYRLYIILRNSTKPIITGAFTKEGLNDMKNMLEAVTSDSPKLKETPRAIFDCCPSSPLMWSDVTCKNLIDCAVHGIPAEIIPAPQMGATSPISIAGTLVEANAEFLSGVVISQLATPGTPIVYGGSPSAFDMRYCTARLGAIEAVMTACASAEIGKYYGIPTHGYLGLSDSKALDGQSGFESGLGILLAAMSKLNIVSGPGMQASENCQSLEKLVIDNEFCGTAYRLVEGINFDENALATEIIDNVGPGGHFLAEKHTRDNLVRERFMPSNIIDRLSPDAWVKAGSRNSTDRAREAVDTILNEHEPVMMPRENEEKLERIFKDILKRYNINAFHLPSI
jgi:trimethylamine--corrinoid protein Co-methyltransferase